MYFKDITKKYIMEKIINQILDLPQMLNQKLPKNCFNEMMDNSEGSVSDWTGKIFKVGALVVLVGMLGFGFQRWHGRQ